ncbi:dihydroneopterin aldolase [Ureibacillus massiliensis 4400831 = CIP 108448 = CCUG 49529]|uniref:Dihydroneopterin aldolase n=1 Tax=Ureibacillus massiliensis 4400831 = CIP 108448 = CCUG 49529 TaxID=1211035 RepID=A0A0A3IYI8_9BACL|nr:thioredoxin domain-containing protein [Ureibacillus massiliensis]KGR87973.1 dihydroneopterin aldolase [Ureibacillus massiliensis 4400831 = CIP 108448 = CCUG 49529]
MKFTVILTLVLVVLIAAIVVISNNQAPKETEIVRQEVDITGQPLLGEEDAPVTVVEFGDFKCPSCKAWGEMIYPQLVEDYVLTGDVKFSYVNVLFHGKESILASLGAESVYKQDPEVYWDFHKKVFAAQPEAANHDDVWVTTEKLLELASEYPSINQEVLRQDLEEELTMEQVNIDKDLFMKHNVSQTPTIKINGITMEDPFDYEAIKEVINQELGLDENE